MIKFLSRSGFLRRLNARHINRWIGLVLLIYFAFWLFPFVLTMMKDRLEITGALAGLSGLVLAFLPFIYANLRIHFFHPLNQPQYLAWLKNSPWRPSISFPFGPAHLVWQDVLVLVLYVLSIQVLIKMSGGDFLPHVIPNAIPIIVIYFILSFTYALCSMLYRTGETGIIACVIFLLGLLIFSIPNLKIMLIIAGAQYAVAWRGLRQSINGFPWDKSWWATKKELYRRLNTQNPQPVQGRNSFNADTFTPPSSFVQEDLATYFAAPISVCYQPVQIQK